MVEIAVEKALGPTKRAVWAGLRAFNDAVLGKRRRSSIAISVKDGGRIVGGLVGYVTGPELWIDMLWIDQEHRGRDVGSRVLALAEAEARARRCTLVTLNTLDFQAPYFYPKLGYRKIGVFTDMPPGHDNVWFRKEL